MIYKEYETIIEILFVIENKLNKKLDNILYIYNHTDKSYPICIIVNKGIYNINDIYEMFKHIPLYKNTINNGYYQVDITNKSSQLYDVEKYREYIDIYNNLLSTSSIDFDCVEDIVDILCNNDIDFDETEEYLLVDNVYIYKKHSIKKYNNSVIPKITHFDNIISIGTFNYYNGEFISSCTQYNLALLINKKIVNYSYM